MQFKLQSQATNQNQGMLAPSLDPLPHVYLILYLFSKVEFKDTLLSFVFQSPVESLLLL